jgi:hypothetical protein
MVAMIVVATATIMLFSTANIHGNGSSTASYHRIESPGSG